MSKKENPCEGCEGCRYFGGINNFSACCNYYLMTGKRRPCPTGKDCTVREEDNRRKK